MNTKELFDLLNHLADRGEVQNDTLTINRARELDVDYLEVDYDE